MRAPSGRSCEALYREVPAESIAGGGQAHPADSEPAAAACRRTRSIALPEAPGVYLFYGDNPLPLYVGKSINLRDRVAAHFCGDWQRETDLRLSQEIRRIEFEETAGEIGALLRESHTDQDAACPRTTTRCAGRPNPACWNCRLNPGRRDISDAAAIDPRHCPGGMARLHRGVQARESLRSLAAEHALCWTALGLERRPGPCFARQTQPLRGRVCRRGVAGGPRRRGLACTGAVRHIRAWPAPGLARAARVHSASSERVDVHVLRDWCWLGTARDEGELARIIEAPPRPAFDIDIAEAPAAPSQGRHAAAAADSSDRFALAGVEKRRRETGLQFFLTSPRAGTRTSVALSISLSAWFSIDNARSVCRPPTDRARQR